MNQLAKMLALVAQKFENTLDKGGQPYVLHCIRVMNQMPNDDIIRCIAAGHDLLEDYKITGLKPIDLLNMGFDDKIVRGIVILTHRRDEAESYDDYIKRVSLNDICTQVKIADLIDNSNIVRLKGLSKKDFDRLEKYHKAYVYLSKR